MDRCLTEDAVIVGFELVLEMNLGQIGTNDFLPQPVRLAASEGTDLPVGTGIRNWRAIKAQCPLSSSRPSRGDPFPAVLVMEAAENRARRDPAVLGEGMSIVTLPRQEGRRRFRNINGFRIQGGLLSAFALRKTSSTQSGSCACPTSDMC